LAALNQELEWIRLLIYFVRVMSKACYWGLLVGLGLTSCSSSEDPALLARVGEAEITAAMLQDFEAKLPAGKEPVDHRAHLQTLVDRELLLQEARTQGLDQDSLVLKHLEEREVEELANQMMRRQVFDRVAVTEEQIQQTYTQGGWNQQVVTQEIFIPNEARARQAAALLKQGKKFDEVAAEYAADRVFKTPTRVAQQFAYSPQDAPRAVVEAVTSLPVGGMTQPIFVRDGYVIARVEERRAMELSAARDHILKALQRLQKNELKDSYLIHLSQEFDLKEQAQGMELVMEVLTGKVAELSAEQRQLPVYTYGDRQVSAEEVLKVALPARGEWSAVTKQQLVGELTNSFFPKTMMAQDGRRKGIDQQEGFKQWRQREQEDLMIARLRAQVVEKLEVSQADLDTYYEAHKQTYRSPALAQVLDVLVEDPEEARAIAARAAQGADLAALAKAQSTRKSTQDGVLAVYGLQGPIYGEEWVKAVMNAPLGEVQGPLKCKGGYSVFKVLERQPASYFGLDQTMVLKSVKREVTEEKERRAFNGFLEDLRRRQADRVEVFEDHLKLLAPAKEAIGV
jgi:parvulin-like peptidyl-prolyl isomerase